MKIKKKLLDIFNKMVNIFSNKYFAFFSSLLAIILIIICILSFTTNNFSFISSDDNTYINNDRMEEIAKNKEEIIIYVYNSKSSNKYNSKIKKYLDSNEIKYEIYNVNVATKNEYKKFLKLLDIDYDLFGYPSLIYIKDGVMFANIINISDTKVVDTFIKDYDLATIK